MLVALLTCVVLVARLPSGPAAAGFARTVSLAAQLGYGSPASGAGDYRPPVAGGLVVLRGYSPPAVRYRAGHLGVDLALAGGGEVLSAGAGTVTFAGTVAGRGVLVVLHPDGIRTEYEPVRALVHPGDRVRAGQPVARLAGHHRGCPRSCLHWGARRGDGYLDPLSLLQPLGPVRLLPWNWAGPP